MKGGVQASCKSPVSPWEGRGTDAYSGSQGQYYWASLSCRLHFLQRIGHLPLFLQLALLDLGLQSQGTLKE